MQRMLLRLQLHLGGGHRRAVRGGGRPDAHGCAAVDSKESAGAA